MLVLTNIGKHISKPKKGEFLYNFFPGDGKISESPSEQKRKPGRSRTAVFPPKSG